MANDPIADRLAVRKCEWRIDALDLWRDAMEKRMNAVEERIDGLDAAEKVARAVARTEATRIANARSSRFSRGELAVGAVVAASSIAGLIISLLQLAAAAHGAG